MGTNQNGDESGKGMVSGRNTVLWGSGIYPGENTGIGYADTYRRIAPGRAQGYF